MQSNSAEESRTTMKITISLGNYSSTYYLPSEKLGPLIHYINVELPQAEDTEKARLILSELGQHFNHATIISACKMILSEEKLEKVK